MFSSYGKCTEALLNVTLSVYSFDTVEVQEPCSTWQEVLTHTLKYPNVDGTFMDVVSSGDLAAVPPPSISETSVATKLDAVLFLFLYFTMFVFYGKSIHHLK